MTGNHQEIEKEIFELTGKGNIDNPLMSIYALEAACLMLDHKFGKDFHKKNPKLAIVFSESIMKNMRMQNMKVIIQKSIYHQLDLVKAAIENKERIHQEYLMDDFADSFKF